MLYVVGIGPGGPAYITKEADDALWESDLIVGYTALSTKRILLYADEARKREM